MKDGKFKCPYCGSTHFEHVFPKNKSIPVFLRQCLRCGKHKFWVYKDKHKKKRLRGKNESIRTGRRTPENIFG